MKAEPLLSQLGVQEVHENLYQYPANSLCRISGIGCVTDVKSIPVTLATNVPLLYVHNAKH